MSTLDDIIVGDLVKLTKGDRIIQGRVQKSAEGTLFVPYSWSNSQLVGPNRGPRLAFADRYGWTLTVVERAPRPVAPGIYTDKEGDVYLRTAEGKDYRLTDTYNRTNRTVTPRDAESVAWPVDNGPGNPASRFAPFTRLAKLSELK